MGQIEKYGLYVLCLVIFLILGVAIWGGDPQAAHASGQPLPLVGGGSQGGTGTNPAPGPVGVQPRVLGGGSPEDAIGRLLSNPVDNRTTPAPTPTPTPTPDTTRPTHRIKSGDVLEQIAHDRLGDRSLVPMILQLNPGLDALRLQVGKEIVLPSKADIVKAGTSPVSDVVAPRAAEGDGWKWYKVEKGDTFEGISLKLFRDVRHVRDIVRLNPDQDPRRIRPGMDLKVPAK